LLDEVEEIDEPGRGREEADPLAGRTCLPRAVDDFEDVEEEELDDEEESE
jgi:hypothetical protein